MKAEILSKCGVFGYFGFEIPNCKNIGLIGDRFYQVLQDEHFLMDMYNNTQGKNIPVFLDNNPLSSHVGVVDSVYLLEGMIEHSIKINSDCMNYIVMNKLFFSTPVFQADCKISSGFHNGVKYELIMFNPIVDRVVLTEKRRTEILAK